MEMNTEQEHLEPKEGIEVEEKAKNEEKEYTPQQKAMIYSLMGLALFILFIVAAYFSPIYQGYDWSVFQGAVQRIFNGEGLYSIRLLYPPWLIVPLIPLGVLPEKIGWAAVNTLNFMCILALARRYEMHNISIVLLIASPPVLYNLNLGNIDIILLMAVFLPVEWLPLAAVMKPQVLFPLGLKVFHEWNWRLLLKTFVVTAVVFGLSLLFFGPWPLQFLEMLRTHSARPLGHNVLFEIWPLQLIVAVPLILKGLERKDERFYLAAAPLMSSYASTGNYIGLLVAAAAALKWWQLAALIVTWWITVTV